MHPVGSTRTSLLSHHSLVLILAVLSSSASLFAQAIFSAAPPLLYEVKTIYVTPSSDDLTLHLVLRLKNWTAVEITSSPEEADAILTCETQSALIPAKVALRVTVGDVTLVDRHSRKFIWKTNKSTTLGTAKLADDIIDQLKKDWRRSSQ